MAEIKIKKILFEFDAESKDSYELISNYISKKAVPDLDLIINSAVQNSGLESLKIERIELNLPEIYINELYNLNNHLEFLLSEELKKIFSKGSTENLNYERNIYNLISEYNNTKILPWWFNKELLNDAFLKNQNKNLLIELTKDYKFFKKIYSLLGTDKINILLRDQITDYVFFKKINKTKKLFSKSFNKINNQESYILYESILDYTKIKYQNSPIQDVISDDFKLNSVSDDQLLTKFNHYYKSVKKGKGYFFYEKQISNLEFVENYLKVVIDNKFDFLKKNQIEDKIFSNQDYFLEGLLNIKDDRLFVVIADMSISGKKSAEIKKLIENINNDFFNIEKKFVSFHQKFEISKLSTQKIKLLSRLNFFKWTSSSFSNNFDESAFFNVMINDMIKHISFKKEKIFKIKDRDKKNISEPQLSMIYSLKNSYLFYNISKNLAEEIRYENTYLNLLLSKQNKFWIQRNVIDDIELINFFKILFEKNKLEKLKSLVFNSEVFNLIKKKIKLGQLFLNFLGIDSINFSFTHDEIKSYFMNFYNNERLIEKKYDDNLLSENQITSTKYYKKLSKKLTAKRTLIKTRAGQNLNIKLVEDELRDDSMSKEYLNIEQSKKDTTEKPLSSEKLNNKYTDQELTKKSASQQNLNTEKPLSSEKLNNKYTDQELTKKSASQQNLNTEKPLSSEKLTRDEIIGHVNNKNNLSITTKNEDTKDEYVSQPDIIDNLNDKDYIGLTDIKSIHKELNLISYFIEFESFPYDSKKITLNQLRTIYNKLIITNSPLVRKYLFNWSKSYIKLQRLYSILFDKNQEPIQIVKLADSILNMVYPDLPSHLDFAFDFYKNFKLISDEENEEHISLQYRLNKILLFWPKYSYVIRNSADLITKVFFNDFEIKPEKIYLSEKVLESFQFVTSSRKKIFLQKIIQSINKQIENKDTQMPIVNNDIENELEEGILINNSGLILFWPFLKTLFVRLNLFDEARNDFKNKLSIDKAILATDYIVNGTESKEKDFVLNKILCGVDLDWELDLDNKINDYDMGVCDSAINAVIVNWEKVNSVQTLRDWFLKREGLIKEEDESYVLTVTNKPFDIFLKNIKYGFGLVNYSILKKKIIVNWKY